MRASGEKRRCRPAPQLLRVRTSPPRGRRRPVAPGRGTCIRGQEQARYRVVPGGVPERGERRYDGVEGLGCERVRFEDPQQVERGRIQRLRDLQERSRRALEGGGRRLPLERSTDPPGTREEQTDGRAVPQQSPQAHDGLANDGQRLVAERIGTSDRIDDGIRRRSEQDALEPADRRGLDERLRQQMRVGEQLPRLDLRETGREFRCERQERRPVGLLTRKVASGPVATLHPRRQTRMMSRFFSASGHVP